MTPSTRPTANPHVPDPLPAKELRQGDVVRLTTRGQPLTVEEVGPLPGQPGLVAVTFTGMTTPVGLFEQADCHPVRAVRDTRLACMLCGASRIYHYDLAESNGPMAVICNTCDKRTTTAVRAGSRAATADSATPTSAG